MIKAKEHWYITFSSKTVLLLGSKGKDCRYTGLEYVLRNKQGSQFYSKRPEKITALLHNLAADFILSIIENV